VNRDQVRACVLTALHQIAPEVDLDTLSGDTVLREEIDLDSMDFLNLLGAIYESTGVDVPEGDYASLRSIDDTVDYVTARIAR
jgi:acyl carrier protein